MSENRWVLHIPRDALGAGWQNPFFEFSRPPLREAWLAKDFVKYSPQKGSGGLYLKIFGEPGLPEVYFSFSCPFYFCLASFCVSFFLFIATLYFISLLCVLSFSCLICHCSLYVCSLFFICLVFPTFFFFSFYMCLVCSLCFAIVISVLALPFFIL